MDVEARDHTVSMLTSGYVAFISYLNLQALKRDYPSVAEVLYRHSIIECSIAREWIANVGGRTALERVGHLICETYARMHALGQAKDNMMVLRMTQAEMGEAMGLSTVHINRVLQTLRHSGLISTIGCRIMIPSMDRLAESSDFHPSYLHLRAH